jgi:5-bromo-4-chloroindolyl phosphate hydrolysis protein
MFKNLTAITVYIACKGITNVASAVDSVFHISQEARRKIANAAVEAARLARREKAQAMQRAETNLRDAKQNLKDAEQNLKEAEQNLKEAEDLEDLKEAEQNLKEAEDLEDFFDYPEHLSSDDDK